MDLAYLPDCVSYLNSSRRSSYSWEQPWVDINKPETKTPNGSRRGSMVDDVKIDKSNCQICKDRQKRNLANYIRDKLRRDSEASTCIREEDADSEVSSGCGTRCGKQRTTSE